MVHRAARAEYPNGDSGSRRGACRHEDGQDRDHARLAGRVAGGRGAAAARLRNRQLLARGVGAARHRWHRRVDPRRPWRRARVELSGVRTAGRQAISADLSPNRAGDRRPHQRSQRLDRQSRGGGAHDSRRSPDRRSVLLFRKTAGPRRHADGRERTSGRPSFGRHRFARRGIPVDEARVPRRARALPQLPNPVARIAGEGARARGVADTLPTAHAAAHGRVRRDPAAGDVVRAACAARRDLPEIDAADRGNDRAAA